MRTVLINSTHLVPGTNNSRFRAELPPSVGAFKDQQVALKSLSMYYSWSNITAAQNNHSLSYIWPTATGTTTIDLTIPDGSYSVKDLNSYMQSQMVANGHYLVDETGNHVYYLELVTNPTYYAVQVNCFALPTSLPSDYTNPGSMSFPAETHTPQLVVPATNMRDVLGFSAGTYPIVQQTGDYSAYSSTCPQVSPTQSIIVTSNLISTGLTNPSNILYSFSPAGVEFGSIIESKPSSPMWLDVTNGFYQAVEIQLYNQDFTPLVVQDPNLVIILGIQDK
jgi:hypothetical protein